MVSIGILLTIALIGVGGTSTITAVREEFTARNYTEVSAESEARSANTAEGVVDTGVRADLRVTQEVEPPLQIDGLLDLHLGGN
jgi:hypothetical protein